MSGTSTRTSRSGPPPPARAPAEPVAGCRVAARHACTSGATSPARPAGPSGCALLSEQRRCRSGSDDETKRTRSPEPAPGWTGTRCRSAALDWRSYDLRDVPTRAAPSTSTSAGQRRVTLARGLSDERVSVRRRPPARRGGSTRRRDAGRWRRPRPGSLEVELAPASGRQVHAKLTRSGARNQTE